MITAVERGMEWNEGLELILKSYTDAAQVRDTVTGLYPCMRAAIGLRSDLTSTFALLREKPHVIKEFMSIDEMMEELNQQRGKKQCYDNAFS